MNLSQGIIQPVLHLLFPPLCRACGEPLDGETTEILCPSCKAIPLTILPPLCDQCGYPLSRNTGESAGENGRCPHCAQSVLFFDRARAAVCYANPYRELIHQFKFKGSWRVRPFLESTFLEGYRRHFGHEQFDGVVPVPLHWMRRYQREFNQAEILAHALGERLSIPVFEKALQRVRYTTPQSRLRGRWRKDHLKGAFALGLVPVAGLNLLVVDDVMTTGMTLSACAEVLRTGGAASVTAYALARRV